MSLEEPRAVALFLSGVDRSEVETWLRASLDGRYGRSDPGAILLLPGYGLAYHRGRFPLPIEAWPPGRPGRSLEPKAGDDPFTDQELCHGGGPGSSACSVECLQGGCGVTCQAGHYACCKCGWAPSCTCVDEDPSGECPPFPCVE